MAVEIRVLGRVDAIVDGRSLPVKGGKQRAVLAMLALRANVELPAEAIRTLGLLVAELPLKKAAALTAEIPSAAQSRYRLPALESLAPAIAEQAWRLAPVPADAAQRGGPDSVTVFRRTLAVWAPANTYCSTATSISTAFRTSSAPVR